MASSLPSVANCMSFASDFLKILDGIERIAVSESQIDNDIAKASLINRVILLGFTIAEIGMNWQGKNSKSLMTLKQIESIPRALVIPIELISHLAAMKNNDEWDLASYIQQGIIVPCADLYKVMYERDMYYEKNFLDMSPEELKTAKRPVYEIVGPDENGILRKQLKGYRSVEVSECLKNREEARLFAFRATVTRFACEVLDLKFSLYDRLHNYLTIRAAMRPRLEPHQVIEPLPVPPNQVHLNIEPLPDVPNQVQPDIELDFRRFPSIPTPLHEDQVLSQFVCSITNEPIRDPVRDPTTPPQVKILYERQAIQNWLRLRQTSPHTREPLYQNQLIECPGLKLLIDRRLNQHYQSLLAHLASSARDAAPSQQDQEIIQQYQ